ncbi:hypothetical protein [Bacillus sp. V59.32b]|uniref:hypothetical protein n=1 Tax=Bacillus sp. V59.32b TaxID=1758642 RepID=UPI00135A7322|nr:hypothetical protein [Bacillus sp. V59.32b]
MSEILNKVKLSETEERSIPTDRAKKYVEIRKLEEESERKVRAGRIISRRNCSD